MKRNALIGFVALLMILGAALARAHDPFNDPKYPGIQESAATQDFFRISKAVIGPRPGASVGDRREALVLEAIPWELVVVPLVTTTTIEVIEDATLGGTYAAVQKTTDGFTCTIKVRTYAVRIAWETAIGRHLPEPATVPVDVVPREVVPF